MYIKFSSRIVISGSPCSQHIKWFIVDIPFPKTHHRHSFHKSGTFYLVHSLSSQLCTAQCTYTNIRRGGMAVARCFASCYPACTVCHITNALSSTTHKHKICSQKKKKKNNSKKTFAIRGLELSQTHALSARHTHHSLWHLKDRKEYMVVSENCARLPPPRAVSICKNHRHHLVIKNLQVFLIS